MKINVKEYYTARDSWIRVMDLASLSRGRYELASRFKIINKKNETVAINDWYYVWKDPDSSKLAIKVTKNHWAVGRKMHIESDLPEIMSGEYIIIFKAQSNSYDQEDFVVVEYCTPSLDTPRKALNWLERQIADLEAKDGLTTEKIAAQIRYQG